MRIIRAYAFKTSPKEQSAYDEIRSVQATNAEIDNVAESRVRSECNERQKHRDDGCDGYAVDRNKSSGVKLYSTSIHRALKRPST
jgi:hypothetical protein